MLMTLGLTVCLMVAIGVAQTPSAADLYQEALHVQEVQGDLAKAIELYRAIVDRYPADQVIAPKALLELAASYEKLGKTGAVDAYQRIVREYATSGAVAVARAKLAAMARNGSGLVARQIWDQESEAVSPDGRYITFTDWNTGDLAVHDLASGRDRVLTKNGKGNDSFAEGGVPSPHSRFIAYGWYTDDKSPRQLRVISRDGGEPDVVYPNAEKACCVYPFGWSPDGQILATLDKRSAAGTPTRDLVLIPASGGAARLVKHFEDRGSWNFSMSPDGRSVAYDRPAAPGSPERDLFSLSVDSGREVPMLKHHAADDYVLGWFPEGDRLLFASDRGSTYGIWSSRFVDGRAQGEPMLIRPDTGHVQAQGFTRKGDFYYSIKSRQYEVYLAALDPTTGVQTGRLTPLEGRYTAGMTEPAWSPNGDRVAYLQATTPAAALSNPEERWAPLKKQLAIQTISTGETRLFPPFALQNMEHPVWLPDGRGVIVNGTDLGRRRGLYLVNIATDALTTIADRDPASKDSVRRHPELSPDGQRIFFNRSSAASPAEAVAERSTAGAGGITVRDWTSGTETAVTTQAVQRFALSPDGQWLALTRFAGESFHVFAIPSSGGDPRPLAAVVSGWSLDPAVAWSRDGRFVFVVKVGSGTADSRHLEIWQVPLDGTEPRNTGISWSGTSANIERISAHPDGRRLAISTELTSSKTWVLQNLPAHSQLSRVVR